MDAFEKKYGIKTDKKVKAFHQSRRMFCIYQNKLFIAEPNLPYSHAVWFEKKGWISKEKDKLMNEIIRGIIDANGDIYFYVGYNFEINQNVKSIFFSYLDELVKELKLKPDAGIFGGLIKQNADNLLLPRKEYGKVSDCLLN